MPFLVGSNDSYTFCRLFSSKSFQCRLFIAASVVPPASKGPCGNQWMPCAFHVARFFFVSLAMAQERLVEQLTKTKSSQNLFSFFIFLKDFCFPRITHS